MNPNFGRALLVASVVLVSCGAPDTPTLAACGDLLPESTVGPRLGVLRMIAVSEIDENPAHFARQNRRRGR
jgi:hypothetical protein